MHVTLNSSTAQSTHECQFYFFQDTQILIFLLLSKCPYLCCSFSQRKKSYRIIMLIKSQNFYG